MWNRVVDGQLEPRVGVAVEVPKERRSERVRLNPVGRMLLSRWSRVGPCGVVMVVLLSTVSAPGRVLHHHDEDAIQW